MANKRPKNGYLSTIIHHPSFIINYCLVLYGLVWSGLVWSGLVWPAYYSISAADMFVHVHSNFDHYKQTERQTPFFFSRPVVEVSLRDDLITATIDAAKVMDADKVLPLLDAASISASKVFQVPAINVIKQKVCRHIGSQA